MLTGMTWTDGNRKVPAHIIEKKDCLFMTTSLKMKLEDIFKPASPEDLVGRKFQQWKKGRPFPFLEYIDAKEVLAKGYGSIKGMRDDSQERSELWVKHGVEVNIRIDEDEVIAAYLDKNEKMTEDLRKFMEPDETAPYKDKNEKDWVESKGYEKYSDGYTGNWDPAYYWGGDFSYVEFEDEEDTRHIIIKKVVYDGDTDDFWGQFSVGDNEEEAAYRLGYDGNYKLLVKDVETWYNSDGEIVRESPDPGQDPRQMRFPWDPLKELPIP